MANQTASSELQDEITVYVAPNCNGSERALDLAQCVTQYAGGRCKIDVVDISVSDANVPPDLFAVPTWYVNGEQFSLGNPTFEQVRAALMRNEHPMRKPPDSE